ncbi:hypothetical protein [Salinicoccus halodurans]|uniref:Bacteriophage protein n=1 Tax=Salinicoccus halodurans TaxID=407035 RepID=A0A0F7HKF7_9STAP|nr:hypothetical protein [Salinicoccus halodurans]AKG74364.1 hypothetical protein AAT16_09030 [Salinicoccus halodurans]SFK95000.1 hypothetical protein SAMN05216235_2703 [Salinicoccus halodurans]
MRDIPMEIYNLLMSDDEVTYYVKSIKFFEYPEPSSMSVPYIVISELDDPLPEEYADNDNLALSYLVQVDLYVPESDEYVAYTVCRDLSYHIHRLLKEQLGLMNTANSQPEYDSDIGIYRRARNYEAAYYREELNL